DPAVVTVNSYDLALTKVLAAGQASEVAPGDDVTFTVSVTNQGQVTAQNIEVTDYIPSGFTLNDGAWTAAGSDATIVIAGPLAPGATMTRDITLTVDATAIAGSDLENWAEISASEDINGNTPIDLDSTPDPDATNDTYLVDNEINGDGTNGGDEDDHDPASVTVTGFDLALTKTLATGQSASVATGDDVTYTITVINQGDITAQNIEITDYIPSELTLNDADWTLSGSNASYTIAGPLSSGMQTTVDITMTLTASVASNTEIENWSEISGAEDTNGTMLTDVDSTPDSDDTNDIYLEDNEVEGDGQNGEDEDDHDPASIIASPFDLALNKVLAAGEDELVSAGDDVTFTLVVTNQGMVTAQNIELTDYLPSGMTLNDVDWTDQGTTATYTVAGPLAPGASEAVDITLTVSNPIAPNTSLQNWAEISQAEDLAGNVNPVDV
ncbi:MAG TPA: NEW3 domain-containing protein, partial [Candidatus Paceibacterota bacterium]|nr:NEW3 domain-containing protein [Candidatus Paceibacterota bacterium]